MAASIFLPGLSNPEQVYGLVCRELLPVGMLGMLVAAIFSATMSSLSSDYNAVASVLTTDVYKRLLVPSASQRDCVLAGRVFTLIVGLVTVEDILEELNLTMVVEQTEARQVLPADETEAALLAHLSAEPMHVDELGQRVGLPIAQVTSTLALMELKGMVRQAGGMKYIAAREPGVEYIAE